MSLLATEIFLPGQVVAPAFAAGTAIKNAPGLPSDIRAKADSTLSRDSALFL
jgi:hypothetical protein